MTEQRSDKHCSECILSADSGATSSELQAEFERLQLKVAELEFQVEHYKGLLREAAAYRFGRSSEKRLETYRDGFEQLSFFNEVEAERSEDTSLEEVQEQEADATTRPDGRPPRRKRIPLSEKIQKLKVQGKVYELPDEARVCSCGHRMEAVRTRDHHELILIPARVEVVRHRRQVYFCNHCHTEDEHGRMPHRTAPGPRPFLGGGLASATTVAYLAERKFNQHVPLYRLEQEFGDQLGFGLTRATMCNWLSNAHERVLAPAMEVLKEAVLGSDHIHMDETVLKVLNAEGRQVKRNSSMWILATGDGSPPVEWYEYQPQKDAATIRQMLKDYRGGLQVDGCTTFNTMASQVTLYGCWAHARRKFTDLEKQLAADVRGSSVLVRGALERIRALYGIEKEIRTARDNLPPEERERYTREQRQKRSRPIVDEYFEWLKAIKPTTYGPGAIKAIEYSVNRKEELSRYLDNGLAQIDNNLAERGMKAFVTGRKNFLFSATARGAQASAAYYSLVRTAKRNHLKIFPYLVYLLELLSLNPDASKEQIQQWMPWSPTLPPVLYSHVNQ